jgi:hypothetical protein
MREVAIQDQLVGCLSALAELGLVRAPVRNGGVFPACRLVNVRTTVDSALPMENHCIHLSRKMREQR